MTFIVFDARPFQPIKCSRPVRDANQKPVTVLVAEDDADQRSHMEFVLVRAGYRVLNASTGDEALARLGMEPVDALICDLNMDHNDGFELIRRIRAHPNFQPAYLW
ncbi:MAG: response regulator [Candidatus Binatia bacterium]